MNTSAADATVQIAWYVGIAISLFFWWLKYRILARAGFKAWWLSLLWSIPIISWFFKIWLAFTPWPERKKRKSGATKPRKTRKRAVA